jgi:hypothetical protein
VPVNRNTHLGSSSSTLFLLPSTQAKQRAMATAGATRGRIASGRLRPYPVPLR